MRKVPKIKQLDIPLGQMSRTIPKLSREFPDRVIDWKPTFADDPSWVESIQNRWLAFLEAAQLQRGVFRPIPFNEIEEAVGMSYWDGHAIMDSVAKKLRNSL